MAQDETQALWRQYKQNKDQATRDRLILTYAPLVKYVAGRLGSGLPAHVDENDLVSYGLLGLIGAIERFDPDRDIKFETYAIARIKGSIIDELRAMDWVPRSVRSRARDIERAIGELERKLMRAPTDEEISEKLGVTVDDLNDSLSEIGRSSIAALDELWTISSGGGGDQVALIDTIEDTQGPEPQTELAQTELKEALGEAIARLPEREKLVVTLYYYEELTLRVTARFPNPTWGEGRPSHEAVEHLFKQPAPSDASEPFADAELAGAPVATPTSEEMTKHKLGCE